MLVTIGLIIGIIAGIFAIVASIYGFIIWVRMKIEYRIRNRSIITQLPPLDKRDVSTYFALQKKELSLWRLLDFRRDIHMMYVHVQETLEVVSPVGRTKVSSPPIPAEQVSSQIFEGVDPDKRIFIIEGNAGSGKSTMLKHWMLSLAEQYFSKQPTDNIPIPIYLSLRYILKQNDQLNQKLLSIEDLANCFICTIPLLPKELASEPFKRAELLRRLYVPPPTQRKSLTNVLSIPLKLLNIIGYRTRRSSRNKSVPPAWIFLCDGLDEMNREQVEAFISWVRGLPPNICTIIATRPGMMHLTNLPGSRQFNMCSFNDEQVSLFIRQWFGPDSNLGKRFLLEIESNKAVHEIIGIPLLLTFLSLEVEVSGDPFFPKELKESDLLLEIVEILLERWDASKSVRPVDTQMIQLGMAVLERIAIEYSYGIPVPSRRLEEITAESVAQFSLPPDYKNRFLIRINKGIHVIQGNQKSGYLFIHKVFFDFFFSRYLIRTVRSDAGGTSHATSI